MVDFIGVMEVELDRLVYYAGEMVTGHVYLEAQENMRVQNIKLMVRGKAHTEWKITRAGDRFPLKQDEKYLDEKMLIWGTEESDQGIPILTRGRHRYPFQFQLPDVALPCSFESKIGNIRYFVRATINIPYASCPQFVRYFTVVGPNIDCMDDRFQIPWQSTTKKNACLACCGKGPMLLQLVLDRTSFVCGEPIRLKAEVQNGSNVEVWVTCKLYQYVEFFINKGVLGQSKEVRHVVLEAESDKVPPHETSSLDELVDKLIIPVMPPTMVEVCGLVHVYYCLKVYLETDKSKGETSEVHIPITIGTVPVRTPNGVAPEIHYEMANPHVEGGMYISPEFQLGQVYMGEEVDPETDLTILYRPLYVCVAGGDRPCSSRSESHLLQVPSRQQVNRSRENVGEEPVQETMTQSSQEQQQTAKLFQVQGEGEDHDNKVVKPVKEDKFLQEITAKIASRQKGMESGEVKISQGMANPFPGADSEFQGQMKNPTKPSNMVHKALVNELRRHMSEDHAEDETHHHVHLKKVGGLKKLPDPPPPPPPEMFDMGRPAVQEEKRIAAPVTRLPKPPHAEASSQHGYSQPQVREGSTSVESSERLIESVSETHDQEVEVEYSEHASLLATVADTGREMIPESTQAEWQQSGKFPAGSEMEEHFKHTMQQSHTELPCGDHEVAAGVTAPLVTSGEHLILETGGDGGAPECMDQVQDQNYSINRADPQNGHMVEKADVSLSIDTTSCDVQQACTPRDNKLCSPKVAPKPFKHNIRHSFPVNSQLDSPADMIVDVATRPKSQFVESTRQERSTDSSV